MGRSRFQGPVPGSGSRFERGTWNAEPSAPETALQRFDEKLLVPVHVVLDGAFAGARHVEVHRHPAVIVASAQLAEERDEIDTAAAQPLVQVDAIVLFLAWRRPAP